MRLFVMATVDLAQAGDEQKSKFMEHLAKEKWQRVSELPSTWWASFKDGSPQAGAISTARQDISAAASAAGIGEVPAAVTAGMSQPTVFKVPTVK